MKKAVVIKTGDTFPIISSELDDFEDWIITGLGLDPEAIKVTDVAKDQGLPDPESISGAVIAGSHAMVTQDLDWSLAIERWLPKLVGRSIPVLGICYGHQLLARAMGGTVDFHPKGLEIGTKQIRCNTDLSSDPLFTGLPDSFKVHVCHSQTVVTLPENSLHIAGNDFEPHHAFRIGASAWGVQFHPEYDQTICGRMQMPWPRILNPPARVCRMSWRRLKPPLLPKKFFNGSAGWS